MAFKALYESWKQCLFFPNKLLTKHSLKLMILEGKFIKGKSFHLLVSIGFQICMLVYCTASQLGLGI